MDQLKLPQIKISDANEHLKYVLFQVLPNMVDFILYHKDGVLQDIDFFFADDPTFPTGISEFKAGSDTNERMITVMHVLVACFNLKWEEDIN